VIEQEMNGSPGMIYMESVTQASGVGQITISFQPGTNADLAQVDVQNRLARATPRLPSAVTQQGVRVDKSRSNFLLFTILSSDDPNFTPVDLGDYASRSVLPEIQRIPGVGQAQNFATAARLNGKQAAGIGVQLAPSGNALATADAIRKRMGELAPYFPRGMKWEIPYDSSRFVRISIKQVAETLLEAVALVFLV